jgi:hypothetical protein
MNIFEEIEKLNLPRGQYIVVGSGIMVAKGIRETEDLDIVVTPELFEKCKAEGWEVRPWTKQGIPGKEWLKKGAVDIYVQLSRKTGGISAKKLLQNAEVINGVPFITLESLMDFKSEYGRPQDFKDIETIKNYLSAHASK